MPKTAPTANTTINTWFTLDLMIEARHEAANAPVLGLQDLDECSYRPTQGLVRSQVVLSYGRRGRTQHKCEHRLAGTRVRHLQLVCLIEQVDGVLNVLQRVSGTADLE